MTTERLEPISLGSCPTCGGPVQSIAVPGTALRHRQVRLPNIDEDLGGGWMLTGVDRLLHVLAPERTWRAGAQDRGRLPDVEYGFGDSPSAAYLALRTAIEARR